MLFQQLEFGYLGPLSRFLKEGFNELKVPSSSSSFSSSSFSSQSLFFALLLTLSGITFAACLLVFVCS